MAIEVYQTSLPSFLALSTKAECCVDWAWSSDAMRRVQLKLRREIIEQEGLIELLATPLFRVLRSRIRV